MCNFVSFFNGGMNENGQPHMAAMAEFLKWTSCGCKAALGVKLCSTPGCNKYGCLTYVQTQIMKHELESIDNPDDNLTPFFIFFQQEMLWIGDEGDQFSR